MTACTYELSVSFGDGRIANPFRLKMAPLCPSISGETSNEARRAAMSPGWAIQSDHPFHEPRRSVPSPTKLARMFVLTMPGFRPKKFALGYRFAESSINISFPATVFICKDIAPYDRSALRSSSVVSSQPQDDSCPDRERFRARLPACLSS